MSFNIDKAQLDEVLAELASDIQKEQSLAKAEGEATPEEESEGSSGPAAPPAEASAPAEGSAPPAEETPVSPEQSAAAAAPEGSPEHEGGEIEPADTVEGLAAEYKQLGAQDPEALKNHYLACKQAIVELMGGDQGAPEGSAPPPAEAAPPAPPAAAPPAPAMKAELKSSPGNGGQKLGKSEADLRIEALEKTLSEEKQMRVEYDAKLAKLVDVMSTPIRKSVKGLSDLKFITRADEKPVEKQAQPLTKSEFSAKLRDKLRGGMQLSKSDVDLVAGFDMGKVTFDKVQHLIADAK